MTPYLGEIRMFGGPFAPVGWAYCDGSLLQVAEYEALFTVLGTVYGGDGQRTFGVPDLRGRLVLHQGTNSKTGSGFVLGKAAGAETVKLNVGQIPAHSHLLSAQSATGEGTTPVSGVWCEAAKAVYTGVIPAPAPSMNAALITPSGGSQAHDNMMPFLTVGFIIALLGIFPSQN
jgi:microcystin-dependent protein